MNFSMENLINLNTFGIKVVKLKTRIKSYSQPSFSYINKFEHRQNLFISIKTYETLNTLFSIKTNTGFLRLIWQNVLKVLHMN